MVTVFPVRKHPRLPGWDYSREGAYFLTICTKGKKPILSQIVGRGIPDAPDVQLYRFGEYVQESLGYIQKNNQSMIIHNWVIMPNHVHILLSLHPEESENITTGNQNPANSLVPRMVSALKRFTNRRAGVDLWQTSYYDHIIRDDQDFIKRWRYIDNNPSAWLEDDYYFA